MLNESGFSTMGINFGSIGRFGGAMHVVGGEMHAVGGDANSAKSDRPLTDDDGCPPHGQDCSCIRTQYGQSCWPPPDDGEHVHCSGTGTGAAAGQGHGSGLGAEQGRSGQDADAVGQDEYGTVW